MRFARHYALVLLCLVLLIIGIYAVEDWRGARAWVATVREVREHGGTTDYAALIPPPIPDDQNLAMAPFFVNALGYHIDPETKQLIFGHPANGPLLENLPFGQKNNRTHPATTGDWKRARATDLRGWQTYFRGDPSFPQAPDPQSPAEGVLMALSRYKAPLDDVAMAAATRPLSRFPVDWTTPDPISIALPHFLLISNLSAALSLRASAEVASGKQADAATDIALGFRLSEAVDNDPFLISYLVSRDMIVRMEQPIWDGLAAKSWDADQLNRLQALLSRQNPLAGYAKAMRSEEAFAVRAIDYVEKGAGNTDLFELLTFQDPGKPSSPLLFLLQRFFRIAPKGWCDQNKSRTVNFEQKYVLGAVDPAAHRVFPSIVAAGAVEQDTRRAGPYTLFYQTWNMVFEQTPVKAARAQVDCDQAAIACALERYFLDHHSYPSDIAALTPGYMAKAPTDVIDGAPMHYQRTPDGRYRLYSIGWNARDDGGQVAWTPGRRRDDRAGDWVRQYEPINPPEVRQN